MGKWLMAYREGRWRHAVTAGRSAGTERTVRWHSPRSGDSAGVVVMAPSDGWVLVETPADSLLWVHESLVAS